MRFQNNQVYTVSIIIPLYNVQAYVEESIRSAFNQSYANIEYILVDDCSTDGTMDVVYKVIQEFGVDKNVKIVHHEYNKGLSAARNTGIERATGTYIFFMDSDDCISPNCIQDHVNAIIEYDADFTDANIKVINGRDRFWQIDRETVVDKENIFMAYFQGLLHISACNKLYSKSFITQSGLLFVQDILYEDTIWVVDICLHAKKVVNIPQYTYNYMVRSGSITTTHIDEKKIIKQFDSWMYILNYIINILSTIDDAILLSNAKKWIGRIRFNISSRLITLCVSNQLKRTYYASVNSAAIKHYSSGLLGHICDLPFSVFYILLYFPRYIYDVIKKYY